ncbi:hypothetical protein OROGR_008591 [Orobanche gracilis]
MAKEKGGFAALIFLVCFVGLSPGGGMMVCAAQGNDNSGTTWCIVKPSTSEVELENIIQFCCSEGGVDCSLIQPGGTCYFPQNKISYASVVMNSYYNIHGKTPNNCYFGGSGLTVSTDPCKSSSSS